jgi:Na+-driven multidrug efflux pump
MKQRIRIPKGLFITIAILLVLGIISGPIIRSLASEEQMNRNVLLSALPFIFIFAAIILGFIAVIVMVASVLNNQISPRVHKIIEYSLIAGIVLGVFGMFQPWIFEGYRYGFLLLLFSTLGFILWSHVSPRREQQQEEIGSATANI